MVSLARIRRKEHMLIFSKDTVDDLICHVVLFSEKLQDKQKLANELISKDLPVNQIPIQFINSNNTQENLVLSLVDLTELIKTTNELIASIRDCHSWIIELGLDK